jgi:broad specificity phosphatase PhoE
VPSSDLQCVRLLLVRHGAVAANAALRLVGDTDELLTADGVQQVERLAVRLRRAPVAEVRTSPRQRATETARRLAAALELEPHVDRRLTEQSFGRWEGLTFEEVAVRSDEDRERLREWRRDPTFAPPGGESLAVIQERMLEVAEELRRRRPGSWVVLVSHVGPIKSLLCAALGLPLAGGRRLFLDPGSLTVVDWGERPVVRLLNDRGSEGLDATRWR